MQVLRCGSHRWVALTRIHPAPAVVLRHYLHPPRYLKLHTLRPRSDKKRLCHLAPAGSARYKFAPPPCLMEKVKAFFLGTPEERAQKAEEKKQRAMAMREKIDGMIAGSKVMIFSKSYCPHCKAAKEIFLREFGIDGGDTSSYRVYEMDVESDGADMQDELERKNGQRTVPNIYVNGEHIGGRSDLVEKKDKVQAMLN